MNLDMFDAYIYTRRPAFRTANKSPKLRPATQEKG